MHEIDHQNALLTLATGDAFSLPGETGTAQDGSTGANGAPAGKKGDPFVGGQFFFIVLIVLAGMIIFSIMGQRRDRKKRDAMLGALKKHDRVQTIGGVIGSVVDVRTDQVVLKVDENANIRMTFARSAIQQVLNAPESSEQIAAPESRGALDTE